MSRKAQPPIHRRFDFTSTQSGKHTTGEFKRLEGGFIGYWWTSGLNANNQLSLLCELQVAWGTPDKLPEESAEEIYRNYVVPLADLASGVRTTLDLAPVFGPLFRAGLLTDHLAAHRRLNSYSDQTDGLVGSIAKQYQLADSLGASTSIEFLAEWNGVPVSTIKKRIERARLEGLIKMKTKVHAPQQREG